jgi:hypothetical protein
MAREKFHAATNTHATMCFLCGPRSIRYYVINKTDLLEPWPSWEHSARLHPLITSLDFSTIFILQSKVVSLTFNPHPGGPGPCIHAHNDRVAQLYPQATGSLYVAFYGSQGNGGGILTRIHTGAQASYLKSYRHCSHLNSRNPDHREDYTQYVLTYLLTYLLTGLSPS